MLLVLIFFGKFIYFYIKLIIFHMSTDIFLTIFNCVNFCFFVLWISITIKLFFVILIYHVLYSAKIQIIFFFWGGGKQIVTKIICNNQRYFN